VPLHHYLQILRKRWITVVVVTFLCVLAAGIVSALTPATYAAHATSFVSLTDAGGASTSIAQSSQFAQSRVESYPEVVHSPEVLQPVIDDLRLDMTVQELDRKVTAVNPTNTVNLTVTATDHDPKLAGEIANGVADNMALVIPELEKPANGQATPVKVTVIRPAETPQYPVSPRKTLNLVLGFVVGLALGIVAALIREATDTTVRSGAELYDLTGLSALGSVRFDSSFRTQPLVAMQPHGFGVEDFRTIRTTLQFVNVDAPPRQIVVSSAIASEGKSFTAVNLAITMAQADLSVCLVEADLRRPRAVGYLGLDGSLGLSDVVAGHYALDDALVEWNRGQLTVLPAGTTPPDPGQLLGSNAMEEVFAELRSRFDRVIIDAPPLLPVSDAVVLGGISDGVIVVARYRHVRREQFVMAVENLRAANATVLGTILTQVPSKLHQARYGDDYDYAHPTGQQTLEAPSDDAPSATATFRASPPAPANAPAQGTVGKSRPGETPAPAQAATALVHPPTKPVPGNNRPKQSGGSSRTKRQGQSTTGKSQGAGRPRT
jgi:capsular exopolysaccharide synthesis family protein